MRVLVYEQVDPTARRKRLVAIGRRAQAHDAAVAHHYVTADRIRKKGMAYRQSLPPGLRDRLSDYSPNYRLSVQQFRWHRGRSKAHELRSQHAWTLLNKLAARRAVARHQKSPTRLGPAMRAYSGYSNYLKTVKRARRPGHG